ncbi:hypothetical protein niasHT_008726 [Heterodera trifolii]|uniref:RNA helicase n=1 Tax=Heterodera trifolii TaxID=157864 RepID=A0ABD2M262_9BILA
MRGLVLMPAMRVGAGMMCQRQGVTGASSFGGRGGGTGRSFGSFSADKADKGEDFGGSDGERTGSFGSAGGGRGGSGVDRGGSFGSGGDRGGSGGGRGNSFSSGGGERGGRGGSFSSGGGERGGRGGSFSSGGGELGGRGGSFSSGGERGGRGGSFSSGGELGGRGGSFSSGGERGGRGGSFSSGGGELGGRGGSFSSGGERGGRGGSFSFGGGERGGRGGSFSFGAGERGGRGGTFSSGDDRAKFSTEEERARAESYIPTTRTIEDIFGDDLKVKDKYLDIREDDDDVEITGTNSGECQQTLDNWKEAGFEELLAKNIERSGYTVPRKIQSRTIPLIMDGHDIKGHAETGSGKSAAFLLPIINTIMVKKKNNEFTSKRICPFALIIEPTREMVIQLYEQALKMADGCGVSVSRTYGKYKFRENLKDISTNGCDILIGTLGRFQHMLKEELILMEQMKVLVLDEADQLLEDESARDLRQIAKIDGWPKVEDRQTLLFSATFPDEVQKWADEWVKPTALFVSNKKPVSANVKVVQKFIRVSRSSKNHELLKLFEQERAELKAEKPDEPEPKIRPTMVFVKMKRTADVISTYLNLNKVPSTTINGDRPQKLRHAALDDFRAGRYQVVVTTDVCARGIDLKELDHVINMDLPIDYTTYVHRIGRTGRIKEGASTSFFDLAEDVELAKELVEGLQKQDQEVPDWLKLVAEGKMPLDESEAASGANSVPIAVRVPSETVPDTNSLPTAVTVPTDNVAATGANSVPLGTRVQDEGTPNGEAKDPTIQNNSAPLPSEDANDEW